MNKVMLVGRLTRDPELRSLPSGKHVATFSVATNEFRGANGERTEYHACVAWDRLAEICGQFLSKGQLVDVDGRLQTRQWDDDAGKRHWKTEVVVASLEMLSGRSKKEYAQEAQAVADAPDGAPAANGATGRPRGRRRDVTHRAAGIPLPVARPHPGSAHVRSGNWSRRSDRWVRIPAASVCSGGFCKFRGRLLSAARYSIVSTRNIVLQLKY